LPYNFVLEVIGVALVTPLGTPLSQDQSGLAINLFQVCLEKLVSPSIFDTSLLFVMM